MICLFMTEVPKSYMELRDAVIGAMGRLTAESVDAKRITLDEADDAGGLRLFRVELDSLRVNTLPPNLKPPVGAETTGDFDVERLEIRGEPVVLSGAPVTLNSTSHNVSLGYAKDEQGLVWLGPSRTQTEPSGELRVSAQTAAVAQAAEQVLGQFARQKGVNLTDFQLQTEQIDSSTIGLYAVAVGKKFGFSAKILVKGIAQLNENLDLVVRDLEARGEGTAGAMAATAIQTALRKYEGHTVSLRSFAVGGATLQELKLEAGETVGVFARYGVA